MVSKCYTTASFSLLVEGEATDRFWNGRRLRQGDPLSPTLFILILEKLSQSLHPSEKNGDLDTYVMGGARLVKHLLFANDILCFSKANHKSITSILKIIMDFTNFYGLHINNEKSSQLTSLYLMKDQLFALFNFRIGQLLFKYLGLSVVG